MDRQLSFWFDFSSSYSYLSAMRIEAAAARSQVVVEWVPFLLGPIFQKQGWNDSPFVLQKAKGAYVWRDMERQSAKRGLAFRRPSEFPRPSTLAMRIAAAHAGAAWLPAFCRAAFTRNFELDHEIASPEASKELLRALALDPAPILEHALSDEGRSALRQNTEAAMARGIFGAPSFVVGEEMFWGDDRLDDALAFAAG